MVLLIQPVDAVILSLYLLGVVVLGVSMGRGSRGVADYLVAGRQMPWWAILLSIVATETSTVTFLSVPGLAYSGDLTFLQLPLGYIVGRVAAAWFLLPLFFRGELMTSYQVLGERFGGATQKLSSLLFLVTRTLSDGLRLYLSAVVLRELTGWPMLGCVALTGAVTILYTALGGMRAVVWTDCVQFLVYVGGGVLALFVLVEELPGGWSQFQAMGEAAEKFRVFDFSLDLRRPHVFLAGLAGGAFLTLATHGTDQLMVQRYLCSRSLGQARAALLLSGVVVLLQFGLFLLVGVGLYCLFELQPPSVPFARADEVFPRFIVHHLERPPGAVGLLLGAVFAAAMSTLSSSLNSSAAAVVSDLLPGVRPAEAVLLRRTRLLTVVFGVLQMVVAACAGWVAGSIISGVLAIAGFTTGLVLGVFLLGILVRRARAGHALAGLGVGTAVTAAVCFLTPLAWPWWSLVGCAATFATGLFGVILPGVGSSKPAASARAASRSRGPR